MSRKVKSIEEAPKGNLEVALEYARRGWQIFPVFYVKKSGACSCNNPRCKRIGKHPATANGVQAATNDESQITQWWTENPYANIGLATGFENIIVMDVDEGVKKDGTVKVGPESLETLRGNNEIPETLMVKTGSGGKHYYFLTEHEFKNSASKVAPDIDFRAYGGYVILPPSNHESGGKYEWLNQAPIADLPGWLAEKLAGRKKIDLSEDAPDEEAAKHALKKEKLTKKQLLKLLEFIPASVDRDTWWQVGAAIQKEFGNNEESYAIFDDWSKTDPDSYDAKTTRRHWESFVDKGITGGTIFHYAKEHGFRGFDVEAADDPEIKDNWIYVASIKRFVETNHLTEWDKDQFDAMFSPMFERGAPSSHVLRNPLFKRVSGVTYWPKKEMYVTEGGIDKVNYWRDTAAKPIPGSVKPLLDHVAYLFPDGPEGNILLDYLAFQYQYPGEKIHWAVLLEGAPGNGKSFFATLMRLVLGDSNVSMVHNDQLHETFTGWQRNTQLIVVEEMMARARLELMNKLKPMITESWCTIREMYRPPYQQPNRFNFLFFTNHKDSLIIDNTDRRYCILKSDSAPNPDENYYTELFAWVKSSAPQIAHFFANRDLSQFKPKAHAPMTRGKRALVAQSMLPLDAFISERVEAQEWPFKWDIVNPGEMVGPLANYNLRCNPKDISNAFARLGYLNLGQRRLEIGPYGKVSNEKVYLWAVRDFEVYRDMSTPQIRQIRANQMANTPLEASADDELAILGQRPESSLEDQRPMESTGKKKGH